jgi:hypothetical protein
VHTDRPVQHRHLLSSRPRVALARGEVNGGRG